MKNFFLLFLSFTASVILAQDPEAKRILDEVAAVTNSFETMEVEFEIKYNNVRENIQSSSTGKLITRGDKYVLETMGTKVIFDGQNMYNIMPDINEITITESNKDDNDFLSNPAKIFTWYERDFKYRYKTKQTIKGTVYHEIDLYPKNLEQPYSRIKVLVNSETGTFYQIKSTGKTGEEYLFTITSLNTNKDYPENMFQFDKNNYPEAEVIDMRF